MATIRQVAAFANVSIGTVSNVLNGRDSQLDPAIRERVYRSIRTLKYRIPAFDSVERPHLTENLALVPSRTPETDTFPGFDPDLILKGALSSVAARGWSLTAFPRREWTELSSALRRKFDGRCDGVMLIAPQDGDELLEALHRRGVIVVQVGTSPWLPEVSSVILDNRYVGRIAAEHLVGLGHTRTVFLASKPESAWSEDRWQGFAQFGSEVSQVTLESHDDLIAYVKELKEIGKLRPTGFFAENDLLALEFLGACVEAGLHVPLDISIVGGDNLDIGASSAIPLTSITLPVETLGSLAATLLMDQAQAGTDAEVSAIRIRPELVHRRSSGPCPIDY
jgi:LacI family transcriptional regulator